MVTACRSFPPQVYKPRAPQNTLLSKAIISRFNNFTALTGHEPLPSHIESEFSAYIQCGIRAYGFARLKCTACDKSYAVPISWLTKVHNLRKRYGLQAAHNATHI
ncbi:transposase zinc-binding domain-containing protein [Myxococcota bacterium]|nr:transposase zinc-binding domain-containing protein [Myxococcota bacterium]